MREAPDALDALPLVVGPCPCDNCLRRDRCASLELACTGFLRFAQGRHDWRAAPITDADPEKFAQALGEPVQLPGRLSR
jgi:hypothetical protein